MLPLLYYIPRFRFWPYYDFGMELSTKNVRNQEGGRGHGERTKFYKKNIGRNPIVYCERNGERIEKNRK